MTFSKEEAQKLKIAVSIKLFFFKNLFIYSFIYLIFLLGFL